MNRIVNYSILLTIFISIILCLFIIDNYKPKNLESIDINNNTNINYQPFITSSIILVLFFVGCYISALIVEKQEFKTDKYCGIFYLLFIGLILLISNFNIFSKEKLIEYISGKKFSKSGVIMFIGIGAIVFGFIDNFGMRLGTEALDDVFVQGFLGPLSKHKNFVKYQDNIQKNFKIINKWTEHDWRKVMNHVLRFRNEISKNKKMKDLTNVIDSYKCDPLNIPKEILKDRNLTNEYVDNLRNKYDIINGSKGMLGNTFSNFCAALLGAGIIGLFTYLTAYDNINIGDDNLEKDYSEIIENFLPIFEAIFITIGCLIPIFLNIAMKSSKSDNNNLYSWIIILILLVIIVSIMFISNKNITTMTSENKKNGIINTLNILKKRYNINSNNENSLNNSIDNFLENIK